MPWRRRLVSVSSKPITGFDVTVILVGFVVDTLALRFSPSTAVTLSYQSSNASTYPSVFR
jgi:hypothetical protein